MRSSEIKVTKESTAVSKFTAPLKTVDSQGRPWLGRESLGIEHLGLPTPPNIKDKFSYDQKKLKWSVAWQIASSIGITYSFLRFSQNNLATALFYIPTALFILFWIVSMSTILPDLGEWDFELHADRVGLFRKSVHLPTVDVFLPSAGEDLRVLQNTFKWVSKLDWPIENLDIYVLDDSDRLEVALLAERYGFTYLVRPNRGYLKKAGNLEYAFNRSKNELIAIFDADFVPAADYLYQMCNYFEDPSIGIVQSPQFFDTDSTQNWIERGAASVQELFYRAIQVARSKIGSPICCGTSAIYRRAALVEAHGFVQIEHSEDVYTGIALRRQGFRTIYIPAVLTKGLCPDTAKAFFNQQYRWCAGSMTLMRDKEFWQIKMSVLQRLCYISGFLYFMFTAAWVFVGFIPVIILIIFLPEQITLTNYIPLIPSIVYATVIQPNWHRAKYGFENQAVRLLTAYAHFFAIKDIFTNNLQGWIPTGEKGSSSDRFTFAREINVIWGVLICSFMLVGSVLRVTLQHYAWYNWIGVFIFGCVSSSVFIKVHLAPGGRK